jgi:hypothetical protein
MTIKKKIKSNLTNILILGLSICIILLLFKKENQIVNVSNPKTIVKNINNKEKQITLRETKIKFDEKEIQELNESVYILQQQILNFKRGKDTLSIIHTQDTLIGVLYYQGQKKDTVIGDLKLSIADLKYISTSKDTLLAISKVKLKKVKRQRNILGLTTLGLGIIVIIK